MMEWLDYLSAPGVDSWLALALMLASLVTSAVTAALGLGGGAMMIAVLSLVWPAAVAVPVHGFVQLGSNAGRAWHRRDHIHWSFVGWFVAGAALGSMAGGGVAAALPDTVFKVLIAAFLIYAAWGPKPGSRAASPPQIATGGFLTSAVGMIVGASGPLVASLLRGLSDRREIVGTHALLMSLQHTLKLLVFVALGFAFGPYVPLSIGMIVFGYVGTRIGGLLLDRLPERTFRMAFKIVLTLIALDLTRRSLLG